MANEVTTEVCQFTPAVCTMLSSAVAEAGELQEIVDTPTCEAAVAVNAKLGKGIKCLANERLEFTRKLETLKKRAMAYEKEIGQSAEEATEAINSALHEYKDKIDAEKIRRAAAAEVREQAMATEEAAAGTEHVTAPLSVAEPVYDEPKIPTLKIARLKVTAESMVPESYWVLDSSRMLKDLKDGVAIPGAEIFYEEVLVRR